MVFPALLLSHVQAEQQTHEQIFFMKLRLIRKYYPLLQDLTYSEILEKYDVDSLFDDIGRSKYTTVYHRPTTL